MWRLEGGQVLPRLLYPLHGDRAGEVDTSASSSKGDLPFLTGLTFCPGHPDDQSAGYARRDEPHENTPSPFPASSVKDVQSAAGPCDTGI